MDPIDETPTSPADYAALNAVWGGLIAGLLATSRGEAPEVRELPVLGLATFSLSKAISREKVGVWARRPVLEDEPGGGRHPRGKGMRFAVGELLGCTRCLGTWSALALVGLRVARPREGRIVSTILATAAINDALQAGFSLETSRANRAEQKAAEAAAAGSP